MRPWILELLELRRQRGQRFPVAIDQDRVGAEEVLEESESCVHG